MHSLKLNNKRKVKIVYSVLDAPSLNREAPRERLIKKFLKFNEYILVVGFLLYIFGFVIENIYLGSFGITNFEVLKVRYILIGGLFSIFVALVCLPTYDLVFHYFREDRSSYFNILKRLFQNAFLVLVAMYFGSIVLTILSGSYKELPVGLPVLTPPQPIKNWVDLAIPDLLNKSLIVMGVIVALAIVFVFAIFLFNVIFNPKKDKNRISRIERINAYRENFKLTRLFSIVGGLLFLFFFFFILFAVPSVMIYLISNKVSNSMIVSTAVNIPPVFIRFMIAVVAAYLGISCFFLGIFWRWDIDKNISETKPPSSSPSSPLRQMIGWIDMFAVVLTFLIPVYSYGIYPSISQQIGGGAAVKVEIITSNQAIRSSLDPSICNSYLIDRTSNSALVLCIDTIGNSYKVLEIQSIQIDAIKYWK